MPVRRDDVAQRLVGDGADVEGELARHRRELPGVEEERLAVADDEERVALDERPLSMKHVRVDPRRERHALELVARVVGGERTGGRRRRCGGERRGRRGGRQRGRASTRDEEEEEERSVRRTREATEHGATFVARVASISRGRPRRARGQSFSIRRPNLSAASVFALLEGRVAAPLDGRPRALPAEDAAAHRTGPRTSSPPPRVSVLFVPVDTVQLLVPSHVDTHGKTSFAHHEAARALPAISIRTVGDRGRGGADARGRENGVDAVIIARRRA